MGPLLAPGVVIPPGATCFTNRLEGANLDELLAHAETNWWPSSDLTAEWELLRNWAIQTETIMIDEAESRSWEARMRELIRRDLPYTEWVAERLAALRDRERARKLAQTNLRYRYGFKVGRRQSLARRSVRDFYRRWSAGEPRT